MPLSAEALEEFAKVCVELARQSDASDVRARLLHMAKQWILATVEARKERDKQQRHLSGDNFEAGSEPLRRRKRRRVSRIA
jgi:hypothetical protein